MEKVDINDMLINKKCVRLKILQIAYLIHIASIRWTKTWKERGHARRGWLDGKERS
jgi:hypothetical protein